MREMRKTSWSGLLAGAQNDTSNHNNSVNIHFQKKNFYFTNLLFHEEYTHQISAENIL